MHKNKTFEIGRAVAAILIVLLHLNGFRSVPVLSTVIYEGISRLALPFFLVLTGFLVLPKAVEERSLDRVKRWARAAALTQLAVTLLYLPFLLERASHQGGLVRKVAWTVNSLIFFPEFHLWYIPQAIGGLFVAYAIATRFRSLKAVGLVGAALYAMGVLLSGWQHVLLGRVPHIDKLIRLQDDYLRFVVITGPLLLLGYLIQRWLAQPRPKVSIAWIVLGLSVAVEIAEAAYCQSFKAPQRQDMFFSFVPFFGALFLVLVDAAERRPLVVELPDLRYWSSYVYFLHIWPVDVLRYFQPTNPAWLEISLSLAFCLLTGALVYRSRWRTLFG